MVRKTFTPDQIVNKLREAYVLIGQGIPIAEARVLIEQWKREYNQVRPHSSLGYLSPAPEAIMSVTLT